MFSHFRLETLLYGDDNLDYKTNVTIVLVVHEFIKSLKDFKCVSYEILFYIIVYLIFGFHRVIVTLFNDFWQHGISLVTMYMCA